MKGQLPKRFGEEILYIVMQVTFKNLRLFLYERTAVIVNQSFDR